MKWAKRISVALVLVFGVSGHAATFETLVGESCPTLTQADFYQYWKHRLIPARQAEFANISYSATYYVDFTAGNDSNSGLSPGAALKTITGSGGVNDKIAASSTPIRVLFARDQRHPTTAGIVCDTKTGVYVGAYGSGRKPVIHCFTLTRSTSWTDGSDGAFYISQANEVGWIRDATNEETRLSPFRYRDSLAEVQAEARTWWWDDPNDRLYINVDDSSNPGTTTYEYSLQSSANTNGIIFDNCDLCTVDGLQFEGFGAKVTTGGGSMYGVRIEGEDTERIWVKNCNAYYCGSHAFGSTGGGICLFQGCRGGYCYNGASSTTTYVFYTTTASSADECIFDECQAPFGHLPNDSLAGGIVANHQGFYCHDAVAGSDAFGLMLLIDCSEPVETWRTNWTGTVGDVTLIEVAGDGTPSTIRAFVVGHEVIRDTTGKWSFKAENAYVGCRYHQELLSTDSGNNFFNAQDGGHCYRCIFSMRDRRTTATIRYLFSNSGAVTLNNCTFFLEGPLATSRYTMASGTNTSFTANDCLVVRPGAVRVMNGLGNNASRWNRLAIAGADANTSTDFGFGNATGLVELSSTPTSAWQSPIGTLAESGASVNGPKYDANWNRCGSSHSYGAIEAYPVQDIDTDTSLETILARIGPWTGDTAKNSVYGALRAMANSTDDFNSPDLTKDDGDGAGSFDNTQASLGGIRSITALAILQEDAGVITGGTTTTVVGPASWSTINDKYIGSKVVVIIAAGNSAGDVRTITDYDGSTKTATVSPAFSAAPASGDVVFLLRETPTPRLAQEAAEANGIYLTTLSDQIVQDVWDEDRASHTDPGTFGEGVNAVSLSNNAITANALATDAGTEIANATLDQADGIETGFTLREVLRLIVAAVAGKTNVSGTTATFRDLNDTVDRITTTITGGKRSAATYDVD